MRLNVRALFLPVLFVVGGVLATESASPTNGTPDVTYPADDAFVFCGAPDCTGTCEVQDTAYVPRDDGEYAPNGMGFQSIYWYDPGHYNWILYTCIGYYNCTSPPTIKPNVCYNLEYNGSPTDFYEYWYLVN